MATTHKHIDTAKHSLKFPMRKVITIARLSIETGADHEMLIMKNWFRRFTDKSFTGYVTADYPGDGSVKFHATYVESREEAIRRIAAERRRANG